MQTPRTHWELLHSWDLSQFPNDLIILSFRLREPIPDIDGFVPPDRILEILVRPSDR